MKILTPWLRSYLPVLNVDDATLAEDLTLRGIAVEGVFELSDAAGGSDGALFDMDITTNRVDAMNHYGIAREIAAIYDLPLHPLLGASASAPLVSSRSEAEGSASAFPVTIEAKEACGRFTAQVIRGVTIAPSQDPIAHYFAELHQKPISNAVDITNYVLLGMGHPTHAFDLDKIEGGITVRRAHPGEQLHLLDGTTRTLVPDDLVIADDRKAISLAGVMGGYDTMITAETRNILVEAAWFDPAGIRATSRRHLIHTDASHRFERGADFAAPPVANNLVSREILKACGGALSGPMADLVLHAHEAATSGRAPIQLSISQIKRHLGTTLAPGGITSGLVHQYLTALGCQLETRDGDTYTVTLPSWRLDLTREIDLIEEIARVYGYNRFANTLPTPGIVVANPADRPAEAIRTRLLSLGYTEALSSTFASAAESAFYAPHSPAIALENPLSEDHANLRPSLLPGMVTVLAQNLTRDVLTARLFEMGACFSGSQENVVELPSFALGLMGDVPPVPPVNLPADAPFYELKGVLESVFSLFDTPPVTVTTRYLPQAWESGRAAALEIDGKILAHFGQLSAAEATRRKLRQPLYLAEVCLAVLLNYPLRRATARELSRFQAVDRDFSFLFPDAVTWAQIGATIRALHIEELHRLAPVEIWRDPKKSPGVFASLTRVTFQSPHRTLSEQDLTGWWSAIIAALQGLGGTLRDS